MARETHLYALRGTGYYEAIFFLHTTAESLEQRFSANADGSQFVFGDERGTLNATHAVFHAHTIIMFVLYTIQQRFAPPGFTEAFEKANVAYAEVWGQQT